MILFKDIKRNEFHGRGGVYIISNTINDKVYVGSAKDFYNRLLSHRAEFEKRKANTKLKLFVRKHGIDCLRVTCIDIKSDRDSLYLMEKAYILANDSVNNGFNHSVNTKVPQVPFTEERKRKIGLKSVGRYSSPEKRKRLSENCIWNNCLDKHPLAKFKVDDIVFIKKAFMIGVKSRVLQQYYNAKQSTIQNIKTGHRWSGVVVEFKDITNDDVFNIQTKLAHIPKMTRSETNVPISVIEHIKYMISLGIADSIISSKFQIQINTIRHTRQNKIYKWVNALQHEKYN